MRPEKTDETPPGLVDIRVEKTGRRSGKWRLSQGNAPRTVTAERERKSRATVWRRESNWAPTFFASWIPFSASEEIDIEPLSYGVLSRNGYFLPVHRHQGDRSVRGSRASAMSCVQY
jgi:hypothetical protein